MAFKGHIAWNKGIKGSIKVNVTSFRKGMIPWNKGKKLHYTVWNKGLEGLPPRHTTPHSEETKIKCSIAQKNRWGSGAYKDKVKNTDYQAIALKTRDTQREGIFVNCLVCNKTFYKSIKRTKKYCSKKCNGIAFRGSKNPLWNGGTTIMNKGLRATQWWADWRKAVFTRDNYTCQKCGKTNTELHPHHIKQVAFYPELIFDVNNGITLCKKCHLSKGMHKRKLQV